MVATPQFIEDILATYQAATKANERTSTRQGTVIVLSEDDGDDVMITADLHGHRRNFNMIRRIADLDGNPRRHLILQEVCHGGPTYPGNGGCMSHTLLEDVARLKAKFPERVHFLMSNHELSELTDYPILKNKRMLNLVFRLGLQEAYGLASEKVRQGYMEFLRSCPLAVRLPGDIFICHSAPAGADRFPFDYSIFHRPLEATDYREHSSVFELVWGRDFRPENAAAFAKGVNAKVLIHGHEPSSTGYSVPNEQQIILDCCGEKAGYLILPLKGKFTHAEIVSRIKLLDA